MSNLELIGRYRNRLVTAKLDSLQRNTGSTCVIKKSPTGKIISVQLTTEVLTRALEQYELVAIEGLGKATASGRILELYQSCLKKMGGMSSVGHAFMDDLIEESICASDKPATSAVKS
ncbi:TPA: hypothetical protein ACPZI4_001328 [Yersinia enterocolitica]|uniref:hypothetical protein n=1 Tax=Yersinia enterocolitica TaxID=630 RepID=UPI0009F1AF13|nr:hypothetical protein [Yersinia enterocolitica]PNM24267.1 hypothetical protein A6J66_008730 [Yersinia enterocolitica]HDL7808630.1 hypothetical protein [Yersinia enterocolitica]HDX5737776.1 hypothetical protein [Yersinia enterocolitica]HEN3354907.1 hypothetical protein [Yersinia enterocolitica]